MYAKPIQQLIDALSKLPSVGRRTAERYTFHLLKSGKKDVGELASALNALIEKVRSCEACWDFSDASPCAICADQQRDQSILAVVKESQDVQVFERGVEFSGHYHVLRGTLTPDIESSLGSIKIKELIERVKTGATKEVILALNPDIEGETTMLFLEKKLTEVQSDLIVTRLARGLPMGSDLRYADDITLGSALTGRTTTKKPD